MATKKKSAQTKPRIEVELRDGKQLARLLDLKQDSENARLHSDHNIQSIAASLRRHGQRTNIVIDADGTIIKGNATMLAAESLGWSHLWVEFADDMSRLEQRTYSLADNKTGEQGTWAREVLAATLEEIAAYATPEDIGFTPEEFARLTQQVGAFNETGESIDRATQVNQQTEWVGMPAFDSGGEPLKIIIQFETEEDRQNFAATFPAISILKKQTNAWSTWWPFRAMEDKRALSYE